MKKIVVLFCILVVLSVSAVLVYVFNTKPSENASNTNDVAEVIVDTTKEEEEIGKKLITAEQNVLEHIENDSDIIVYKGQESSEISEDVYNNIFSELSADEINCVAALISEWSQQVGCNPSTVNYISDNFQSNNSEVIINVGFENAIAEIHMAYDFNNEKLIGYITDVDETFH